jgi:hypothetical protein
MKILQIGVKQLFILNLIKFISAFVNWTEINEHCGVSGSDRIIGGTTAELGQYPWIAHVGLLRNENGQFLLRFVEIFLGVVITRVTRVKLSH